MTNMLPRMRTTPQIPAWTISVLILTYRRVHLRHALGNQIANQQGLIGIAWWQPRDLRMRWIDSFHVIQRIVNDPHRRQLFRDTVQDHPDLHLCETPVHAQPKTGKPPYLT